MGLDAAALRDQLKEYAPNLVCVSTTTPGLPGAIEACQAAKLAGATVILGGPHTEAFSVENLVHSCIDFVGVGEGITIVPQLAAALRDGLELTKIPGLVGRDFNGGNAPMVNLEQVGWPAREGLPMGKYHSIMAPRPFATMISSRGCPFQCSFCFKQAVDKKSMYRSADDVVGEMEYLQDRWGVREIMFYDDVFTMHRKRVYEICQLIRKRRLRIRWEAPTRVDLVPPDLLKEMAASGCVRLRFGIEHGDPEILERMNKESNLATIEKAVQQSVAAGIRAFGYFIVGYLNETREQFERTVDLACRLPLDYASFYTATPLPGTALCKEAIAAGIVPSNYWSEFVSGKFGERVPVLVPDAEQRAREAYKRFYIRKSMVIPLIRHMLITKQAIQTAAGLVGLARSNTNTVRDF
jgi:radical SAM superfamily enzyme YgiQ (UPF0313 family)